MATFARSCDIRKLDNIKPDARLGRELGCPLTAREALSDRAICALGDILNTVLKRAAVAVVIACGVASNAGASSIGVFQTSQISDPTNQTSFESITQDVLPANTVYQDDGIVISQLGTDPFGIVTTDAFTGMRGWASGGGNTTVDIHMSNDSTMQAIQFYIEAGDQSQAAIYYQFFLNGNAVEPVNHTLSIDSKFGLFSFVAGPDSHFDDVRFVISPDPDPRFTDDRDIREPHTTSGVFMIDDLSVIADSPPTAVPEPETWALMISGFGLAGATLRRRGATA